MGRVVRVKVCGQSRVVNYTRRLRVVELLELESCGCAVVCGEPCDWGRVVRVSRMARCWRWVAVSELAWRLSHAALRG